MTYQETLDFLYLQLPMFSRIGSAAYKKDLTNTIALCEYFNHPQDKFKSIHIGGTNGKGSTTNYLASMFVEAGRKVGIYTSPHLIDFRERIKIGNQMVSEEFVVDFVEKAKPLIEKIQPSFFELTVVMAFEYFAQEKVDIAMIEVGLGGRLDSTNVITPELCVITNVSFDHMNMLGNTIEEIAFEKAGIIKKGIPCIIGESNTIYNAVFEAKASESQVILKYASECIKENTSLNEKITFSFKDVCLEMDEKTLGPPYQRKNIKTAICAFADSLSFETNENLSYYIQRGIERRTENTGFLGRWTKLNIKSKTVILESAHNEAGIEELKKAIHAENLKDTLVVFGCVRDKDVTKVISLLPKNLDYILSQADIPRAMPVEELAPLFIENCNTPSYQNSELKSALDFALAAKDYETILVTGSIFLVGEALGILSAIET
jgi:dihydrofolate synthase/folylpolyglutamate synthase